MYKEEKAFALRGLRMTGRVISKGSGQRSITLTWKLPGRILNYLFMPRALTTPSDSPMPAGIKPADASGRIKAICTMLLLGRFSFFQLPFFFECVLCFFLFGCFFLVFFFTHWMPPFLIAAKFLTPGFSPRQLKRLCKYSTISHILACVAVTVYRASDISLHL